MAGQERDELAAAIAGRRRSAFALAVASPGIAVSIAAVNLADNLRR